jgi:hypothetical protein
MHAIDAQAVPEQLIAELNRRRHWKMFAAISGLILALGALLAATLAMYSDEPGSSLQPPAAGMAAASIAQR